MVHFVVKPTLRSNRPSKFKFSFKNTQQTSYFRKRNCFFLKNWKILQKLKTTHNYQARSQKFAMGGGLGGSGGGAPSRRRPMGVLGRSPQPPEAGVWRQSPQPPEARGSEGRSPQRSKILHFFAKITSF